MVVILSLAVIAFFSYYVYKYTIPQISPALKIVLITIRTLVLLLILLLILEPIANITYKDNIEPVNLVFVDNSKSIAAKDSTKNAERISNFLNGIGTGEFKTELIAFGDGENIITPDSITEKLNFNDPVTNLESVVSSIKNNKNNAASAVIVSDGIITEGSEPLYEAEKLDLPLFTIGIGDTTEQRDVEIKRVLHNKYIYAEEQTSINAAVLNNGYGGSNINASLYADGSLVEQQAVQLNENGINNISFTYTPESPGRKKLQVIVSSFEDETTTENNRNTFYIDVLDNKIEVLLVAGSPSSDLSFIRSSLAQNENLNIRSLVQISENKFLNNVDDINLVDSADVLYLIGFPQANTPSDLQQKVLTAIRDGSKPYFITVNSSTDLIGLSRLDKELPFGIANPVSGSAEAQPYIANTTSSLLGNINNSANDWDNLPPVLIPEARLNPKPESDVLLKAKVKNVPLETPMLITRTVGKKRSIALLAGDIWKWKLQASSGNNNLIFDTFIANSLKWLHTDSEKELFTVTTSKNTYSAGEDIEFSGELYDETLSPVNNADVELTVTRNGEEYNVALSPVENGIYEGILESLPTGDYTYTASAVIEGNRIAEDRGSFNVGDVNVELLSLKTNTNLMRTLAVSTGGSYHYIDEASAVIDEIEKINSASDSVVYSTSELNLWANEYLLFLVIILFGIEWFARKRAGML